MTKISFGLTQTELSALASKPYGGSTVAAAPVVSNNITPLPSGEQRAPKHTAFKVIGGTLVAAGGLAAARKWSPLNKIALNGWDQAEKGFMNKTKYVIAQLGEWCLAPFKLFSKKAD